MSKRGEKKGGNREGNRKLRCEVEKRERVPPPRLVDSAKRKAPPGDDRNWKDVSSLPLSLPAFPLHFAQRLRLTPRTRIKEGARRNRRGRTPSSSGENNERLLERGLFFFLSSRSKERKNVGPKPNRFSQGSPRLQKSSKLFNSPLQRP